MQDLEEIRIYHILHVSRFPSVLNEGFLWSDAIMSARFSSGNVIGLANIKRRRLESNQLRSWPGLYVGQCVPFYFCPRSIMLYVISGKNHPDLLYRDGQADIVHLEARLKRTIDWANRESIRWALTLSNAGAIYVEDYCQISDLGKVNWPAVFSCYWQDPEIRGSKQAEFLLERHFPIQLVEQIGVSCTNQKRKWWIVKKQILRHRLE